MTINGKRRGKAKVVISSDVIHKGEPLPCMKIRFETEATAKEGSGRSTRVYMCNVCSMWHRTSRLAKRSKVRA